jgi:hypothetical protein
MSTFREKYLKYDISSERTDILGLKGGTFQTYANAESKRLDDIFYKKYIMYKMKYIQLKNQLGGLCKCSNKAKSITECNICSQRVTSSSVGSSLAAASNPPSTASSSAAMSHSEFVTALREASASSSAAMGNPEPAASASSSAAMGNPEPAASASSSAAGTLINITVNPMIGEGLVYNNINPNMTIWELKQLIERNRPELPADRQKIMYRPGPFNIEAIDDRLTLGESIDNTPPDTQEFEFDLLLSFPPFNYKVVREIIRLNKNGDIEELDKLLSQYEGDLKLDGVLSNNIIPLCKALEQNRTVTGLDLRWNRISKENGEALAAMLKVNTTMTKIDLGSVIFRAGFIDSLAEALKVNNTITELDLSGFSISEEDLQSLTDALVENKRITTLNLSNNDFDSRAAILIARMLERNNILTNINLRGNNFTGDGMDALYNAEGRNPKLIIHK